MNVVSKMIRFAPMLLAFAAVSGCTEEPRWSFDNPSDVQDYCWRSSADALYRVDRNEACTWVCPYSTDETCQAFRRATYESCTAFASCSRSLYQEDLLSRLQYCYAGQTTCSSQACARAVYGEYPSNAAEVACLKRAGSCAAEGTVLPACAQLRALKPEVAAAKASCFDANTACTNVATCLSAGVAGCN